MTRAASAPSVDRDEGGPGPQPHGGGAGADGAGTASTSPGGTLPAVLGRTVLGMVARQELSAAQAKGLIAALRAELVAGPPPRAPAAPPVPQPIAVIGMAGRFPGAETPEAFWTLLAEGRSGISPHPPARWAALCEDVPPVAGGWLDGIEQFDPAFFGITRREAEVMDPQQRLFLETAYAALEQAGYAERDLSGRSVGVYVGAGAGDYAGHLIARGVEPDGLSFMGNSNAILAGRVAYLLNLRGPCLTVDTACSSSLTAVHLAREALLSGSCEMAVAGGVCLLPTPTFARAARRAGMLSPSGTCRAFDAEADGFVPGEAVAALILKPLDRALADGDHVWGVIEGSASNQDGRTNGITAPSAPAQAALIRSVHDRFGIDPATIGYVEAHGTGTRLGDPIEIEALTRSFRRHTAETGFCAVGSVKSAVGHTMSAAGAVGLVKLMLSLAHRQIPPTLNVTRLNPACDFPTSPFRVETALTAWPSRGGTRRAAISAFGFSGSNVHMVLAEAPARDRPPAPDRPRLMLLSGRSPAALRRRAADLAAWLAAQSAPDLDGLCWTLAAGRAHHPVRAAWVVEDAGALRLALESVARDGGAEDMAAPGAAPALAALAARYRAGETLDPQLLVAPEHRRRLPLPTSPFERIDCALRPATRPRLLRGLHPLLDRIGPDGAFRTAIGAAEPVLADHVVRGRAILPGACIAAMALAAARLSGDGAVSGLSEIVFRAPVGAAEAADLRLALDGDAFTLSAGAASARGLATGRLTRSRPADAPPALDLAALRGRLPNLLEGEALAARFAEAGVALGPLFRGVRRLWLPADPHADIAEALAELALPGEELAGLDAYDLHPTLLDGAFQAGMALLAAMQPERRDVLVPAGIGGLDLHARCEPGTFVHVRATAADLASGRPRFDACLVGEDGRVRAVARDFTAARLPTDAAAPTHVQEIPPARNIPPAEALPAGAFHDAVPLYRPVWRPIEAIPAPERPDGAVVILRDATEAGARLADALSRALGDRAVLQLVLGETTGSLAAGIHGIDRSEAGAFPRLFAQLKPLAAAYLLGSGHRTGMAAADLAAAQADLLPRLAFLQALALQGRPLPVRIVTCGAQPVRPGEVPDPGAAMLAGLGFAAARELVPLRVSVLDLSPAEAEADPAGLATRLVAEPDTPVGEAVALREGGRWRREMQAVAPGQAGSSADGPPGFREGGAYVIVGGTGGLGLALALHLARTARARLLLIGRSPLSASQGQALAAIEAAGGQVLHIRADAADPAQLAAALAAGRERFGRFDGAVQAAMVLRDTAFMRLDAAALAAVMAPKLAATAHLAEALRADRPDLFVLYSSANAFIGNPGQANYAAAAAGQDALGLALRADGLPVTVVNWGYWGEVGAVAAPVFLERAAGLGIGAITVPEGLAALAAILAGGMPQAMAMKVSAATLTGLGIPAVAADRAEAAPAAVAAPFPAITSASLSPSRPASVPAPVDEAAIARLSGEFDALERTARDRLVGLFQGAGLLRIPGEATSRDALRRALAVVPAQHRLFDAVIDILCRAGLLEPRGDGFAATPAILDADLARRVAAPERAEAALAARAPWLAPFVAITRRCLAAYGDALAGRIAATELLFPRGSSALVAPLYRDNPISDHFNAAIVAAILDLARAGAGPLRITEVGAGTGGTAGAVMRALRGADLSFRYRFTDLSPTLVRGAAETLGREFPEATFAVLDLERPLAAAEGGASDVVVAVNVLHATAEIAATVAACHGLLAPGGRLLLAESVRRRDFATLVFGLTEGWWRFRDAANRLPHSPLLDQAGWRRALTAGGFGEVVDLTGTGAGPEPAQAVLLARRPAEPATWPASEPSTRAAGPADETLSYARSAIRRAVAEALRAPLDTIDDAASFTALGIDSISGVDLTDRLATRLGLSVPVTALFDHPSPAALAAHLATDHAASLTPPCPPPAPAPTPSRSPAAPVAAPDSPAVAVVGMAGMWPGAPDLETFWHNLREGRDSTGLPPAGRWPDCPPPPESGPEAWRQGGFLTDIDRFDPLFFEMSGVEADHTDPQARLFLTTAWRALEQAGYGPAWLDGRRCGVFVGVAAGDYPSGAAPGALPPAHAFMGNAQSVLAGRLAYLLNLRGPALAVDTACSSSLVALHLACRSIAAGECELAVVGGAFVTATPAFHRLAGSLGMTSPAGVTRAFDDRADGFVPAEGVGAVVLRRLDAALAEGDPILAVVRATGSNQDGRTHGLTAPSSRAQADLIAEVLDRAGLPAASIDYVEAHGTGTPLGDPIEVEALARVLRRDGPPREDRRADEAPAAPCLIGSVKTNIGHAGPAAGMAGLHKLLLALAHETLPASLHYAVPNRHIDVARLPLAVCTEARPWRRRPDHPRRAGLSAFGLSGTNAHAVIEEAPLLPDRTALPQGPFLVLLSGRTAAALAALRQSLAEWLEGEGRAVPLADVAATLAIGRRHMAHRLAVLASDAADLRAALATEAAPEPPSGEVPAPEQVAAAVAAARAALLAGRSDGAALAILARAYRAGMDPDWIALHAGTGLRRVAVPGSPFAQGRHWVTTHPDDRPAAPERHGSGLAPRAAGQGATAAAPTVRFYAPAWQPARIPPVQGGQAALPSSLPASWPAGTLLFDDDAALAGALGVARRPIAALDGAGPETGGPAGRWIVLHPGAGADPLDLAQRLLRLARHRLTAPGERILVLARTGTEMDAVAAAAAALGVALRPQPWSVLRLPPEAEPAEVAAAVRAALADPFPVAESRWRDGQREVRVMRPLDPAPGTGPAIRTGSVCWIVGGTGALGSALAAHLRRRHGATVVVSGRRPAAAGHPDGLAVDVTDAAAVRRAVAAIRDRHGRIDAVFHLAGTLRAAPLAGADEAAVAAVLAPKILGALHLDAATRTDRLGAFVLFSSLAAELGDFGQGDYAFANRFLGAFAEAPRKRLG
ncbi:SDR family NAD(P)-dependent oxidoreductase, partial [Methylobacterium aquaticum]